TRAIEISERIPVIRSVLLSLLILAACTPEEAEQALGRSRDTADAAADSLDPAAPEMPSQAAAADTSWTRDAVVVEGDEYATLLVVRTGSHEGFDRIVMSFGSAPLPGYRVEYVNPPVHACGSGAEV